jgi:sugar lactone lactonase YvrE
VDGAANLYIADNANGRIRKVAPDGTITSVLGNAGPGFYPIGVALDAAGNLFIADHASNSVRRISTDGRAATVVTALVTRPGMMAVDGIGNVILTEAENHRVRKFAADGSVATIAGYGGCCYSGDGGPATAAQLNFPAGVAVDRAGNVFIADTGNQRVRKVGADGTIWTVAGNGEAGFSGDGGPATRARLNAPLGLAVDEAGNLFIADNLNHRVRKVDREGIITTVAGAQAAGFSGDGEPAAGGRLSYPFSLATDAAGTVFIVDAGNRRIRKISTDGLISTVWSDAGAEAGMGGIAVDRAGNLFIAEQNNRRIRKIDTSGRSTTVASHPDLRLPASVCVDDDGNLFVADSEPDTTERIVRIAAGGEITTIAGRAEGGYSGDGGPARAASMRRPLSVAVDSAGRIYVADSSNSAVRVLLPARDANESWGTYVQMDARRGNRDRRLRR